MKRFVATFLLLALIFTTTACSLIDPLDANSENTESNSTDSTTETNDVVINGETEAEALSKQEVYDSVSSFISDIPYNSELYSTYNFTDDGTLFFFQFYIFGTERRLIYLLKSCDGGNTWYPQDIQSVPSMSWREDIVCAKMLDESIGLISGKLHATDNNFSERTYITTNGGRDWTQIVLPATPPFLNEESTPLSNYLDGEAYDLTQENGVYYLHVRVSVPGDYHYLRYSSTDLSNWTFVESANINGSENSPNTNESESTSNVADFSSYEAIIETYKSIVNCFYGYSVEQYQNNEYVSTLTFPDEESRTIYDKIFSSAYYNYKDDYAVEYLSDGRNYFGYAFYDLNKNGSDELILLNDHYDIIAIFTNYGEKPQLIIHNEPYCRIDSEGKIYTQNRVYEENEYYPDLSYYYNIKVHTLTQTDELVVAEEYQAMNPHGNYSFFIDVTNGLSVEISRTEFIKRAHGCLYNTEVAAVTQSSLDLDFVRLFSPINPHIPEMYSWMWYEYVYMDKTFVVLSGTTETTINIGFYANTSPWTCIAGVTATRSGEKAYFESETLSGRLEFGLDCIWIVITESQSEEFPCGAYIYQYYETPKG